MQNTSQNKKALIHQQYKIGNNEFKKVFIKIACVSICYYFDDIIELEDLDIDNILIDEQSHENILIYDISNRTFIGPKPLYIRFDKIDGFIRIDGTRYLVLFGPKNMMLFTIALDIL